MKQLLMLVGFCFTCLYVNAQNNPDDILGKWMYEEKNLVVEVYREYNDIKARIVWFYDDEDTITPLETRLDEKNPDKELRSRKLIGLDILSGLEYNENEHRWVKGKIYDSSSGRTWDSTVWIEDPHTMKVRGYYIFRFVGKTLTFTKM